MIGKTGKSTARLLELSLALLALSGAVPTPSHSARTRLKVQFARYLSFAPLAIAKAEGFFEAQGLDVELVTLTGNHETTPALIQGEIDVGAGMLKLADFNAIARGAALRLVADKGHFEAGPCVPSGFVARPEFLRTEKAVSPDSADHIKGARVSSRALTLTEFFLETFLGSKGLRVSDLNVASLNEPAAVDALARGSLDFTYLVEPSLSLAIRTGHAVLWKPTQEIVPGAQLAAVFYGPNLLERNREAGRRFMSAYLEGVRQYNRGKTERNVEILAEFTELDRGLLKAACWQPIRGDGKINVESVLDFERWAVRKGVVDEPLAPERFWDPSFAEAAVKALGAIP